ncbi:MAG: transglycosylase SLT domain-containing protein, partial [Aquificota bacterium]|nr:transglycosylase SLT domain-containing protein [Aquificota bacterium]
SAMGLMQLLEKTARWKARRIGYRIKDIYSPEDNIYLGTAYLKYLLDLWNGDLVKTLASYNARVRAPYQGGRTTGRFLPLH